jgi:hypothetical protein
MWAAQASLYDTDRNRKIVVTVKEALRRLAGGETQADVARTYNVDATTIGRLLGHRPFHGGANLVALQ